MRSFSKKCLLVFSVVWAFFNALHAQNQVHVDSLLSRLENVDDTQKIEIYLQLANHYYSTDPELALKYAADGESLALEINNPTLIGKSKSRKGVAYYYMDQMELSTQNYFEALNIFDSLDLKYEKARALNNIGWNLRLNNQLDDAILYFNRGLEITRELNDLDLMQAIYNNLGTAYRHNSEKQKALDTYLESLKINKQVGNRKWEAYIHNNIGLIYIDLEEYNKSEEWFLSAIDINQELEQHNEYVKNLLNLGLVSINKKDLTKAEGFFEQANSLIEENHFDREKLIYYYYLARLNKEQGNFEGAYENLEKYTELDRDLNTFSLNNQIAVLRSKYELAQETIDLQLYKQKVQEQRFIILGGVGLSLSLLVVLALVFKLYKSKHEWAKNIEKLNEEIKHKNLELKALNDEIQGANSNLEKLVEDRTIKIRRQNEKLVKYAFINSHEIRGPLARVLGLVSLLKMERNSSRKKDTLVKLKESSEELDKVVKKASTLLEEEGLMLPMPTSLLIKD